ncbi:MAG: hypothetical protein WBA77_09945 [Microcoleaceae cyanobacterium]
MTSFPISGTKKDRLSRGKHMETSFTLDSAGKLRARTKTWSTSETTGFTGGVIVVLTDENKNELWFSEIHRYGVNGKWVPGGPDERIESWEESVSTDILSRVRAYAIIHQHTPTNRVFKGVKEFLKSEEGQALIAKAIVWLAA